MKTSRLCVTLIGACCLLMASALTTFRGTNASAAVAVDNLSSDTNKELARARNATAKYHNVAQAEADGYVNAGFSPGEGFEYVNEGLIDCEFDPEQPEILLYAFVPSENHLRLVGVEYVVPLPCSQDAPEGFSGDADVWRGKTQKGSGSGSWLRGFGCTTLTAFSQIHLTRGFHRLSHFVFGSRI